MGFSWNDLAALTTLLAISTGVYELRETRRSLRDNFERSFVNRYERIVARIDLDVILRGSSPAADDKVTERAFYDYFMLLEEELYYRAHRRVSKSTWKDWWYGIQLHLRNEAFVAALRRLQTADRTRVAPGGPELPKPFMYVERALEHRFDTKLYEPKRL